MTTVGSAPVPTRLARARLRGIVAVLAPVVLCVVAVMAFGVATVQHDSMAPTLRSGGVVVFDRWSEPSRGDIVLFVDRQGWSEGEGTMLVKRVVGLPGDVVVCCDSLTGRLLVNDEVLEEPYVDAARTGGGIPFHVIVPEGTVWVLGDNRTHSTDSRATLSTATRGAVARDALRGVVRVSW
ncbi:signal peptidase I [Microbacterium sp. SLBN-146]|uniref:signal peptidase I n=1 Tax=Microbacterium sp. SLBN-146 TaxID=2768457 RepID=UPI00114FEE89|nr:signal peptidase I [Microbacterium sp. SLBN-146]TQJ31233.1 signal peptidase I [Microbacterium sp. SLBN-146]